MIQDYNRDLYKEGIQNVVKSVILYSITFRRIAEDLADLYRTDTVQPFDYTTLFKNFYERTNQLIEAVSTTMAELVRRETTVDVVRSKTTNALRKEIVEDSFHELNENLQSFQSYMTELGIMVEAKAKENEFLTATLTAGAVTALLSGTRKVSFTNGIAVAAVINQTSNNNQQVNQIQSNKVDIALAAMVTTTSLLQNLVKRLMDQYCSLVYGGQIDLNTRDSYLNESNDEINLIADLCNRIAFSAKSMYDVTVRFRNYKEPMTETEQRESDRKLGIPLLLLGCIVTIIEFYRNEPFGVTLGFIILLFGFAKFISSRRPIPPQHTQETPIQFLNKMANLMTDYASQLEQITNRHLNI